MIRHPLQSAAGRSRPDLNRVADGIAASLRQFSISARRSATADHNDDGSRPKSTGRQRSAAAVDEIISVLSGSSPRQTRAASSVSRPVHNIPLSNPPAARAQGPNTITVKSLPRDGGPNRLGGGGGIISSTGWSNEISSSPSSPNVIRGGFRGRGRGQGGNFGPSSRGPPSQGGSSNRDDRPRRARGGGGGAGGARGGRGGRGGGGRRGGRRRRDEGGDGEAKGSGAKENRLDSHPKVKAHLEQQENGRTLAFNPPAPADLLRSLAGYGPAVATAGTPFGQGETALRQARVLGGGGGFHPQYTKHPDAVRAAWRDGTGVFVPPSDEARRWTDVVLERMLEKSGEGATFGAPAEVKTAVLEDALLGRYGEAGPGYAEAGDTVGTIRSYVRRDGTWNAQARRDIEAKVRSLLPQARGGGAGAADARTGAKA
ncbi:hypothetical protein F4820DRAFT_311960 [Hypoxylon rubiginosum]|uniref:Uncharacterized protein n=1 Tax=Hypoxylon rubiginosum TaxID=110542 RepID=A0ACB9Z117_9PEZI|nr:hypothetical protein F4820DRAFT_311960 [Hypoxylon rubiginosum]